jgi:hypothetical protein
MQENNNQTNQSPIPENQTHPNQTPPPTILISNTPPPPPTLPPHKENRKNPIPVYTVGLIMLLLGIGLGFFLIKEFPQFNTPNKVPQSSTNLVTNNTPLTIPKDAVQIETCEDNKGSLFVKPQDIPQGPIYMSYKGKVVGLEFMLNTNQIMQNGKFDFLSAENIKIDHIRFGYLSEGHEGNPVPHFHADLYTVPRNVEEAIKCPAGQSQQMNMPGMDMGTGSSSASMSPVPSNMQMLMQQKPATTNAPVIKTQ